MVSVQSKASRKVLYLAVLLAASSYSSQASAKCGSWKACIACINIALASAESASSAAFSTLHQSIRTMGTTFASGLASTSVAIVENGMGLAATIQGASNTITTQTNVGTQASTKIWDEFNAQEELRAQQVSVLDEKQNAERNYNPDTISKNVLTAFATQNEMDTVGYANFIDDHRDVYKTLLEQPREEMFGKAVVAIEDKEYESLLWQGEIEDSETAIKVSGLTRQLLFGSEADPFGDIMSLENARIKAGDSGDATLLAEKVLWRARLSPVLDLFALDQGLRTKPSEDVNSLMAWLDENITDVLTDNAGVADVYANASEKDLKVALAMEIKKQNLLKMLDWKLRQIQLQISAGEYAMQIDKDKKKLRTISIMNDYTETGESQ